MKIFKKVFAFAIALAAIAMASSAMAADAVYNNGVVSANAGISGEYQATVAVVDADFGKSAEDTVVDNIYYIDQDKATAINTKLAAGVAILEPKNFTPSTAEVRVGGAGDVLTFAIPEYVVPGAADVNDEKITDEVTGVSTVGFDGTITVNGGTFSNLIFKLTTSEVGEDVNSEVEISTADRAMVPFFQNSSIGSIVGNVTFGLEIAGVPDGVTVTFQSVTVAE